MSSIKGRLLLTLFLLAFAVPSFGGSIDIDFGTGLAGIGGTFNLLSGGQASGSGVPIGVMTVSGDAGYNGVYGVTGTCAGGSGCLAFDTTTSTISIDGVVDGVSGTLLSGKIASFLLFTGIPALQASGPDTKNAELLTALGIAVGQPFNYFGFTIATNATPGVGYEVISTDIKNSTVTPEPVSMLLMGTFFSLAGGLLSKKKRA
jgi:hypothetical protein